MKQETGKKKSKLWLWLVIAAVALVAVAGVVVALVLGGEKDTGPKGGRPELYWNIDRKTYTESSESGLSTREPGEDGLFKVRFTINGEIVEQTVADKRLVNIIDTMDAMGLVKDSDGVVVDVLDPKDIAKEVAKNAYVKLVETGKVVVNSSVAMNGMNINVVMEEGLTEVYDVTPEAEVPGQKISLEDLNPMDTLMVYANDMDQVTHVYVNSHPKESKVYWRAQAAYDSKTKSTKREPDENGVYTVPFFCDGEVVELKSKDRNIVSKIDAAHRWKCDFGFVFDEEGYIIGRLNSAMGIQGVKVCENWNVLEINGDTVTIQKGNDAGSSWTGSVPAGTPIYEAGVKAKREFEGGRKVDSLQLGDRVTLWTDTKGDVALIYISERLVEGPAYWNVSRKYDSTKKETTRKIGDSGYYEVQLVKEGSNKKETYYVKDKETMSYMDSISARIMGLKVLPGNIVQYAYNEESLIGYTTATRGGVVTKVNGSIFSKITSGKPDSESNLMLAPDARVWNVSEAGTYGEATTLQPGDIITGVRQIDGRIQLVYVTRRTLGGEKLYWNLKLMWDSKNKTSTRVPDAEGWYHFTMAYQGKQVQLKTKDKTVVDKIDKQSIGAIALDVSGGIIYNAYDPTYAYGGSKLASGYTFRYITEEGKYYCTYSSSSSYAFTMAEDCKIYNVSNIFSEFKGERIYSIPVGAMVSCFADPFTKEVKVVYVRKLQAPTLYWKTETLYDSTNNVTKRVPDADGYYWYDLAVDGECKRFKTKDKDVADSMDSYAGAFGLNVKGDEILAFLAVSSVENVSANGYITASVKAINGRTITVDNGGKIETMKLTSDCKIFDVSPTAEKFGAKAQLKVGDVIRTYKNKDKTAHSYVYIKARPARVKGETGWCEACQKVVDWKPTSGGFSGSNGHWYLPADLNLHSQITLSTTSKDYTICLDLNGKTMTHVGGVRNIRVASKETLNIMDSVGGGKIVGSGADGATGGMLLMSGGATVNMYGGTIEYVAGTYKPRCGGVAYISGSKTVFNMYGGTITGGTVYAQTKSKYAYGGNFFLAEGATLNMYGGEISDGRACGILVESGSSYSAVAAYGGNIYMSESSHVNILGGVVKGGQAVRETFTAPNGKKYTNATFGGNLYKVCTNSHDGSLRIENATVTGGKANRGGNLYIDNGSAARVELKNATISDGHATQFGGNIMTVGAQWKIVDSKILNGSTDNHGGNIYSQGGNFETVTGTTISGGKASVDGNGGNIYLYKNKTDENIFVVGKGTVIKDGVATDNGGNIYVRGKAYVQLPDGNIVEAEDDKENVGEALLPALILAGGEIKNGKAQNGADIHSAGHMSLQSGSVAGDIFVNGNKDAILNVESAKVGGEFTVKDPADFMISGAPVINKLVFYKNVKATIGKMTSGASVKVSTDSSSPVFTEAFNNAKSYLDAKYFEGAEGATIYVTEKNELAVLPKTEIRYCEHCKQDVEFVEWTNKNGDYVKENGHFILTKDVTISSNYRIGSSSSDKKADAVDVVIELNGHNITATSAVFYVYPYSTLSLQDSVGTSVVSGEGALKNGNPRSGGVFYLEKGNMNIYSGTYTLKDTDRVNNGGIVYSTSGALKIFGGVFNGNTINGKGSVFCSSGTFELNGGTVNGSILARTGANVTLSGAAKVAKTDGGLILAENVLMNLGTFETGAEIFVSVDKAAYITGELTNANDYLTYIKPAVNGWNVAVSDKALFLTDGELPFDPNAVYVQAKAMDFTGADADGKVTAVCPVCREEVEWSMLPTVTSDNVVYNDKAAHHFYLDPNTDYTKNKNAYVLNEGTTVCINLNGQTMETTTRAFIVNNSADVLNIMGEGVVIGKGTDTQVNRGVLDVVGKLNLYGGTYESKSLKSPVMAIRGSSADCVVNMYEGTTIHRTENGVAGLNVFIADHGELNMYGGIITGGNTSADADIPGGNIWIREKTNTAYTGNLNVYGGTISNGVDDKGGNIYASCTVAKASAQVLISGGEVLNGGVYATGDNASVIVENNPVVDYIDVVDGNLITVGSLTEGASITVRADGIFTEKFDNAQAYLDARYFVSGIANSEIAVEDNALKVNVTGSTTDPSEPSEPEDIYENGIYEIAKAMDFTGADADGKVTAECPVCKAAVEWLPLPEVTSGNVVYNDKAAHHFYLDPNTDYTQNKNAYTLNDGTTVCINLNGQTMETTTRAFIVNNKADILNIMGEGVVIGKGTDTQVTRGVLDVVGKLNLYGGTYESKSLKSPVMAIRGSSSGCVVNMYEGTTIHRTEDGVAGLCVYMTDHGELNMYGGIITGGNTSADADIPGGNIWLRPDTDGAKFSCDLNVYGGTISNGVDDKGGNIYAAYTTDNPTVQVKISGGEILNGAVYATGKDVSVIVENNPVVDYIDVVDGNLITVNPLTEGASIKVKANKDVAFTNVIAENAETYAQYFVGFGEMEKAVVKDNALVIADVCPHCGVEMANIQWTELTLESGMNLTESGHFYLTQNYEGFTSRCNVATADADVVIDFRGHTVTVSNRGLIVGSDSNELGCTLSLMDTVGNGGVTTTTTLGGGVLYVATKEGTKTNTLNVYGGTYQNTNTNARSGGCLYNLRSNLNIYGGTFYGTTLRADAKGANLYTTGGTTNVYGGTFIAGNANGLGDCAYIEDNGINGILNVYGGTLQGQVFIKKGAEIAIEGAPVLENLELGENVKIQLGKLTKGADITVKADGEFTTANEEAEQYVQAGYIKAVANHTITAENNILKMAVATLLKKLANLFSL